jgi:hypothetical protein
MHPRFNHVALSLPADQLAAAGRADVLRFYGDVFGWTELPTLTLDRERLVLRAYSNEQFVFLHATSEPMQCGAMEHFGMSVDTKDELDAMYERARKFCELDSRVYVRYLLPLHVEVQCYEWSEGFDAYRTE